MSPTATQKLEAIHDATVRATSTARNAAWLTFGEVSPDLLTFPINPMFRGAPAWPNTRQAYSVTRGPLGVLIASDGLADPFDFSWEAPAQQGMKLEVFAVGPPGTPAMGSWLFALVNQVAMQCAHSQTVSSELDRHGTLTLEIYGVPVPIQHRAAYTVDEGRVGVLLGTPHPRLPRGFRGPMGDAKLVHILLLRARELRLAARGGAQARARLAAAASYRPLGFISRFDRPSLLDSRN